MSLTVLALAIWPRTYAATVALMVNYEVNDPSNGKELPVGQVASYIATQVDLMQTPEVLLAVVDRLNLTQKPDYARGYRKESGPLNEWVAAKLGKTLVITQSLRGSQLIYLTYSSNDPADAAQVANAVAEVYKEQDYKRSTGPSSESAKRYALELNELKTKVNQAQTEFTEFKQLNGLIDEGNRSNVDAALQTTLGEHLLMAQSARRAAESRALADQSVSDQMLSSTQTQALKTQLAAQELRQAQLARDYTPLHPAILDGQLQIETIRLSLAAAQKSYSDNASAMLSAAQRLEQSLQRSAADQRTKILAKSRLQDEAAKYLLELESAQSVYKRALEGYDRVMFASGGHYSNVSLISRATPPVSPSKPKVLAWLILGGIAATMLGFGIPMAYELFNRRVRSRDDLERLYGVPVLAEFGRLPRRRTA